MDNKESFFGPIEGQQESVELLAKLTDMAKPGAVFGEPITANDQTVITASEVMMGLGVGFGGGSTTESAEGGVGETGSGGGGGGGGVARPVAVIHVNEDGVEVEPIVDVTKIALAMFTTLGAMFLAMARIRKAARKMGR